LSRWYLLLTVNYFIHTSIGILVLTNYDTNIMYLLLLLLLLLLLSDVSYVIYSYTHNICVGSGYLYKNKNVYFVLSSTAFIVVLRTRSIIIIFRYPVIRTAPAYIFCVWGGNTFYWIIRWYQTIILLTPTYCFVTAYTVRTQSYFIQLTTLCLTSKIYTYRNHIHMLSIGL